MKNGTLWTDTSGKGIQAHGGCILEHEGTYYWYGENKDMETKNRRVDFVGFSCYSSRDLVHWQDNGLVLPAVCQEGHDLSPAVVGERPSVLYNRRTRKFVMWFHQDSADYTCARVGLAVSDSPTGPFTYQGSQRPGNHDSRDMTAYMDENGKAYLFCSSDWNATMRIWELDETYMQLTGNGKEVLIDQAREAPAVFFQDGKYYMVSSGCTGWRPNTMLYATANALFGSWWLIDNPCTGPNARTTFGSQSAAVFQVKGQWYLLLDHWKPENLRESAYSILPVICRDGVITIPWQDEWNGII